LLRFGQNFSASLRGSAKKSNEQRKMVESEIKKVAKYLQVPIGKLSYTDDNIIQMKAAGDEKIVGFSSIINFIHQKVEKENQTSEQYFLTKQYFDFANLFIRGTSKRDKCKWIFWSMSSRFH
jgi:hypothetical protein